MLDYNRLLAGKRALITTGARGIGKSIAELFVRQGAIVCVGGRDAKRLAETMQELQSVSPQSKGYVFDLSSAEQTEKTAVEILEDMGGIDILVNTVGINARGPAHQFTDPDLQRLLETNYTSGLRFARKFLPGMMARKSGNIVNISSIHALMTMPDNVLYAGTKGAMNAAARAMALDYADYGIRINTVCPGLIMSAVEMDALNEVPEGPEREQYLALLATMQPLPPGQMIDVAHATLFLASEMSSYITGQVIMVDGGSSIKAH